LLQSSKLLPVSWSIQPVKDTFYTFLIIVFNAITLLITCIENPSNVWSLMLIMKEIRLLRRSSYPVLFNHSKLHCLWVGYYRAFSIFRQSSLKHLSFLKVTFAIDAENIFY